MLPGDRIATCAHVVAGADDISADFPLLGTSGVAVVVDKLDEAKDIAVLRMESAPSGVRPAPVRLDLDVLGHRFRVMGFTAAEPDGVWVSGTLAGVQGAGRVQMAVDPDHEQIAPGFSGAPVWDRELGGVVGMVVTRSGSNETTAHLLSISAFREWVDSDRNPYRGLDPLRESDADRFYGRDDDVAELLKKLGKQSMVAISGPSGSGKSSLVRAGLIPRLKQAGTAVTELGEGDPIPTSGVLFLDQFEEEVVADRAAAQAKLEQIIQHIAEHPLRVVLTLRSQSLDDLITPDTAQQLGEAVWLLKPMRPDKLREAIELPAERAGLAFEAGLPEAIVHDCPPGQLSLLSAVLDQLCKDKQGVWLTHEAYQQLGRVSGALGKRADDVLSMLGTDGIRQARRLLTGLTRPDGGTGHVRRSANLADLEFELQDLALEFAKERLVVVHDGRVELPHQALIDHWPRLRKWLAEDADFLAWQTKLHDLKSSGAQLTGALLAEASSWAAGPRRDIPKQLREYIQEGEAAHRRTQRRWRTITAVSVALALVALLLTGVVTRYAAQISDQLRTANAAQLAQASERAAAIDPRQGLQLALAAYHEKSDSPEAYGALFRQRLFWQGVDRVVPPEMLPSAGFWSIRSSADGRVLVVYPVDRSQKPVALWDVHGPNPRKRELPIDPAISPPASTTLSPDGRFLAVDTMDEGTGLRLLELADPDKPIELVPREKVDAVRFSWNGRFLGIITADASQPVRVWDLVDMRELPSRVAYEGAPGSGNFTDFFPSPDGRSLITEENRALPDGSYKSDVVVRDRASGEIIRSYPGINKLVGGGTLLIQCDATGLRGVDPLTGRTTGSLPGEPCAAPLGTDVSGQYLMLSGTNPDGFADQYYQVINWATWQRGFIEKSINSETGVVLIPRDGRSLTTIEDNSEAMTVRNVDTALGDLGHYDQFTPAPDKSSWAAISKTGDGAGPELALLDESGAVLASTIVPVPAANWYSNFKVLFDVTGDRIVLANGPKLYVYRAEDLVLDHELQLPVPPGHDVSELGDAHQVSLVRGPGGELVISAWGMLSFWNPTTGMQIAPPIVLAKSGPRGFLPETAVLTGRPGYPEQVLLTSEGRLTIWDLRARKPLGELQLPQGEVQASPPAVSADGAYAVVGEHSPPMSVINLNSLKVEAEVNAELDEVIGLSGPYLFTSSGGVVGVWNWREQRSITSETPLQPNVDGATLEGDSFVIKPGPRQQKPVPLDPEEWFAHLCELSGRKFTDQELSMLPPGASTDPPCG
ncbi:trypsin-like peptidase domain-containing protein [Saccharopolyspora indica]